MRSMENYKKKPTPLLHFYALSKINHILYKALCENLFKKVIFNWMRYFFFFKERKNDFSSSNLINLIK